MLSKKNEAGISSCFFFSKPEHGLWLEKMRSRAGVGEEGKSERRGGLVQLGFGTKKKKKNLFETERFACCIVLYNTDCREKGGEA